MRAPSTCIYCAEAFGRYSVELAFCACAALGACLRGGVAIPDIFVRRLDQG